MGQSSVLLVIAATLTIGILLFAAQRGTADADVDLAGYHYKVLSREASSTGINLTVRKLVDDQDQWLSAPNTYAYTNESYYGATFTTTVTPTTNDTVDIVSTGTDESGTHVIEATYVKAYTSLGVPPSLRYAIISDDDLTLNGHADISAVNDESNANIHTNSDLVSNGSNVHVEGYGSYAPGGSGQVNPEKAVDQVFDPNVDENGGDQNMYLDDYIDIPELIFADYYSNPPADEMVTGDLAWGSENLNFGGTAEDPYLIAIDGNLTISGNVSLGGYVQVVVNGTISISGNVTATATPPPSNDAPQADWDAWTATQLDAGGNTTIGYYAVGDIALSGNSAVVGQLFSNGSVTMNGGGNQTQNVIGGITSANVEINVNGGVNIQYAQISEATLLPGWTNIVPDGVRLISWAEW